MINVEILIYNLLNLIFKRNCNKSQNCKVLFFSQLHKVSEILKRASLKSIISNKS